jgi:hypothetical protein
MEVPVSGAIPAFSEFIRTGSLSKPQILLLQVLVVLLRYNNGDTQLLLLITSSSLELKKISSEIQHILLAPR